MKGQKRKLQSEDSEDSGSSGAGWERQRQSVFYISLDKYQRGQELPEPSLRRSVLIANTLRQITLETGKARSLNMEVPSPFSIASALQEREKESVLHRVASPNPPLANCHSTVGSCSSEASLCQSTVTNSVSTKPPANDLSNPSNFPSSVEDDDEDWVSMSSDPDFSLSAAITSILTALDSTIDGSSGVPVPQAAPRTPLRSLENLSVPGSPEGDVVGVKQGVKGHWGSWDRQGGDGVSDSSVEVMRSSYLGDVSVDDLFQDIDTSLLEREMGTLGMRGGGLSPGDELLRYLPPFSSSSFSLSSSPSAPSLSSPATFPTHPLTISLNHSLKCLPSFSALSSSSSPLSSYSPFSGQSHLKDVHDLEHLMEILVES